MGTRSRIAMKNDDGSFTSIYVHWDGYVSHHGPILRDHYTQPEKVKELMALGDLSSLGNEIGEKHDFDNSPDGQCNAYGRDRGEKNVKAENSADLNALNELTQNTGGEYLYVFQDGAWYVAEGGISFFGMPASEAPGSLKLLDEAIKEGEKEDD